MSNTVDITGIDKPKLLAALYNNSEPVNFSSLAGPGWMTEEKAAEIIKEDGLDFDYLYDHEIKINLGRDKVDPYAYDRNNGEGRVASIVENLRKSIEIQPETSGGELELS